MQEASSSESSVSLPPQRGATSCLMRSWRRLAWLSLCGLLLALTAGPFVARRCPELLVERGSPQRADAIVVLAGDHRGARLSHAVALFEEGHLPEGPLLLSGGPIYPSTTWAQLMRQRAIALGVPPERIRLQDRSATTEEDARFTHEVLALPEGSTLLLVTSAWHSGRAAEHFREVYGERVRILSCPAPAPAGDWWRDAQSTRALATEVLKRIWPGEGG